MKKSVLCAALVSMAFLGCSSNSEKNASLSSETPGSESAADFQSSMNNSENQRVQPVQNAEGLYEVNGIVIVNKKYPVPSTYNPGVDPTAEAQVNALLSDMVDQGYQVGWSTSNFRSYDYQSELYNNYVAANGQAEADRFSARPGYSEHQTGLAFDLTDPNGELLTTPEESRWLLENSWRYGFIVRYQDGKEAITGYMPEPWHLRYVGDQAQAIAQSGLTLEEYLGVEGGDYQ